VAFSANAHDGETVVEASGEIDLANRQEFKDVLDRCEGRVVVDLANVTFIDSSGIGVLVATRNRLIEQGGELRLRNPQDVPRRVLEVVGVADWIDE
jgi:anti-anti-sigma factor